MPRDSDRHWDVINSDMLLSPGGIGGKSFVITVNVPVTNSGNAVLCCAVPSV
jgi:hypothetical protein